MSVFHSSYREAARIIKSRSGLRRGLRVDDAAAAQLCALADPRACEHRAVRALATIGVYGFTLPAFLAVLADAEVALLIDVRQRRGVRGSEYSWANSRRLQAALADAAIAYEHHPELAPTTELRQLQYAEDARLGVGKRSRSKLAPAYVRRYTHEILDRADLEPIVARLRTARAALLCVERDPEACHRSLIAARIAAEHGVTVEHLLP